MRSSPQVQFPDLRTSRVPNIRKANRSKNSVSWSGGDRKIDLPENLDKKWPRHPPILVTFNPEGGHEFHVDGNIQKRPMLRRRPFFAQAARDLPFYPPPLPRPHAPFPPPASETGVPTNSASSSRPLSPSPSSFSSSSSSSSRLNMLPLSALSSASSSASSVASSSTSCRNRTLILFYLSRLLPFIHEMNVAHKRTNPATHTQCNSQGEHKRNGPKRVANKGTVQWVS